VNLERGVAVTAPGLDRCRARFTAYGEGQGRAEEEPVSPDPSSARRQPRVAAILVAAVAVVSWRGARAEEGPAPRGEAVEIRDLSLDPDARLEDARGLSIVLRYRVGTVEADKALYLLARIGEGGARVKALAESASLRDRNDGSLHGKRQIVTVPRGAWREASMFVPFYAMKLAPGAHRLDVKLEAVSAPGNCKTGELPHLIPIIGDAGAQVAITKPPYKMIQVLVRRIEVDDRAADVSIWPWRARPDLRWRLRVQAGAGGVMHSSEVRDDVRVATWTKHARPFPLSQGDLLTISVLDQDVMGHDELGRVKVSLDELLSFGPSTHLEARVDRDAGGPKVLDLELGPVKVR
jgi:hypothetical protein